MPSVDLKYVLEASKNFELIIISDQTRRWLRLGADGLIAFWSEKDQTGLPVVEVARELRQRLQRVDSSDGWSEDDAIEFWPEGWDFWGRGLPAPLLDFLNSSDFERQASAVTTEDF